MHRTDNGSIHAEIRLIRDIIGKSRDKSRRKKINIFVFRVKANGQYGMAKPCIDCVRSLQSTDRVTIGKIYFTMDNGEIGVMTTRSIDSDDELTVSSWSRVNMRSVVNRNIMSHRRFRFIPNLPNSPG